MTDSPVSGPLPQSHNLPSAAAAAATVAIAPEPTPLQSNPSPSSSSSSSSSPNPNHASSTAHVPGTMNMTDMRSALPGIQQPAFEPQPYYLHQMPHNMPHNAIPQPGMFYPVYPQYYPHQPPYPGFSPAYMQPPSPSHPVPMYGQPAGYGPGYVPAPYPMMGGHNPGYLSPQGYVHPGSYAKQSTRLRPENIRRDSSKSAASHDRSMTIVDGSTSMKSGSDSRSEISPPPCLPPPAMSNTVPGAPRRTPKQSGHALWVGNLPPGTSIVDLKDHFSQGVSPDIESVFLISKSNCAFINYKTEDVCSAAQTRFHDSRFQGVRLVCRLRRGVIPNGSAGSASVSSSGSSPVKSEGYDTPSKSSEKSETDGGGVEQSLALERLPNRYFIVKSLTIEDLESSRQSGIWATQTHNEVTLNRAYDTADNVYLIFSANKSGEYYGYARMVSPIQDDEKLALEMPSRTNHAQIPAAATTKATEPNVTLTPATATARSGRIIDDPARGTIFWEVDTPDEDNLSTSSIDGCAVNDGDADGDVPGTDTQNQTIGRPFRIQWLSTERVPFHRTRGLRNPWNANRGVKIARDGTEIEPSVGAQVVELFHIPSSSIYRPSN